MFTSLFPFGDEVFISNPASKFGKGNGVGFAVTVIFLPRVFSFGQT
jgi:hypothetical protein